MPLQRLRHIPIGLHGILGIICLGCLLPVLTMVKQGVWNAESALLRTAFPLVSSLTLNTLAVGLIAMGLAIPLGGLAAWAVTRKRFKGQRLFSVLLCLPFAFPPYLLAGIYQSLHFEYPGLMPDLQGNIGAGVIFGAALYPWVYVPLKMQIATQSHHYHECGRALGLPPWERFCRIRLGLLLPTLGMSALLVLMEVASDFGTVTLLGSRTLSVGIHDAMFSMYRRDWAAQLSLLSLSLPLLALTGFAYLFRQRKTYQPTNAYRVATPTPATGIMQWILPLLLTLVTTLTLGLPLITLVRWSLQYIGRMSLQTLPSQIGDTLSVALWVTGLALGLALTINILIRLRPSLTIWHHIAWIANLNFAIPSVMLAISMLFISNILPQQIVAQLLSESSALLIIAGLLTYTCFPLFFTSVALGNLPPRIDDLCRLCGVHRAARVIKIYLPLLKQAIAAGALLVIINMIKELTLSQVLHPFGFQSLSMRLYRFAGLGMLEESALFALALILIAIYPVATLDRILSQGTTPTC